MQKRKLGKTRLEIGELGLGTEYLNGQDADTCERVIRGAFDAGVTYYDVLFAFEV